VNLFAFVRFWEQTSHITSRNVVNRQSFARKTRRVSVRHTQKESNVVTAHAKKAYAWRGGKAPLTINLRTRWRRVMHITCRSLYPQERNRYPLNRRPGGPKSRSGCYLASAGIRTPDLSSSSLTNTPTERSGSMYVWCKVNFRYDLMQGVPKFPDAFSPGRRDFVLWHLIFGGSSVQNWLHVALPVPRVRGRLADLWNICAPLFTWISGHLFRIYFIRLTRNCLFTQFLVTLFSTTKVHIFLENLEATLKL
jgi:hypothetical protein